MAYPDYEKLCLLEVLVESVYINKSKLDLDKSTISNLKETCVMFQFLDYPPLVVCEEDWLKSAPSQDSQINFESGKSCMFSINSKAVPQLPYNFDINVSVLRKLESKEGKIVLGTCKLDLGDSFSAILYSSVAEPDLPLQRTKSGTYEIRDTNNTLIGHLKAFIRLSCFGQLIVTQFQVGTSSDLMFKGTEPKKVVEIPGDSTKTPKFELDTSYIPTKPTKTAKFEVDNSYIPTKSDKSMMLYGFQDSNYTIPSKSSITTHGPEVDETGDYREVVAEIRGHSLHIRIPMKSKKDKGIICKSRLMEELEDEAPICPNVKTPKLCDCDFQLPQEVMASMTPRCPRY